MITTSEILKNAKAVKPIIAALSTEDKNRAIMTMADCLVAAEAAHIRIEACAAHVRVEACSAAALCACLSLCFLIDPC